MSFLSAIREELFLQNALIGGFLTSIVCGVIGPLVYVRQIGYVAGAIAHTVLGGMGIAFYYGFSPLVGAMIASIIAALIIGWVGIYHKEHEDSIINALWATGMAIGIIFIYKTPGYDVQLLSYLFGNILMITSEDIFLMLGIGAVVIFMIILFYPKFLAITFDPDFAKLRGVPIAFYNYLLLILIAISTVLLVQIVGLILVMALLLLPSATASYFSKSLPQIMFGAILGGAFFTELGIYLSYEWNYPSGAIIILLFAVIYLFVILSRNFTKFLSIKNSH